MLHAPGSMLHSSLIAPSLLAGDHANLAASARAVADCGATWLHCDIMDGHFVPNLTFGPETLAAVRRAGSKLFLDTHLMLVEPQKYIEPFARAGANLISIHIEPAYDHRGTLARIRQLGCQCGIVLNPGTPRRQHRGADRRSRLGAGHDRATRLWRTVLPARYAAQAGGNRWLATGAQLEIPSRS